MTLSMRNTKNELLTHIAALEQTITRQARELAELRLRKSVVEGELALRPRPSVVIERHGQRVVKRYAPPALPETSKV